MEVNKIIQGDALEVIKTLPDNSINCIITSPPYWGLRDYGIEGQIGLEETPEEYVAKLVEIFRELRRVLREDGTCWLNLGSSYARSSNRSGSGEDEKRSFSTLRCGKGVKPYEKIHMQRRVIGNHNLKPKDLIGIPWRVAFALQADGWWLRSDIIWAKKNPMPESVRDRPTKSHEYIFLLTKSAKYHYDQDAIREPISDNLPWGKQTTIKRSAPEGAPRNWEKNELSRNERIEKYSQGRNKRSVWTIDSLEVLAYLADNYPEVYAEMIAGMSQKTDTWQVPTKPYKEAHFAVMPEKLVEPCLLAGCPYKVCAKCGMPWKRQIEIIGRLPKQKWGKIKTETAKLYSVGPMNRGGKGQYESGGIVTGEYLDKRTTGFISACQCNTLTRPGVVLDPFFGSGTVAVVAIQQKRDWLGIELNADYIKMAKDRIQRVQPALFVL